MSSETLKDFYHGKSIFLTGGTGFLGRLILAKLMRIGNVKEVVLLSRPKKGKSNEERLDSILEGFLFQEMEKFDSKFRSKVKLVNGDMEIHNLGISNDDREYIKKNTQIVIHGAATVRFDEDLKKAIAINIRGTKIILDIATECSKLQSFVHISTAYSNCPTMEIEEKFYPPPVDYRECIKLAENCDNHVLNVMTEKLIYPWPNTYTFTKAIAEDLVRQYLDRLPAGIIRPSIVQSTLEDPVAGFVDKLIGPVGLGVGIMAGLIRIVKTSTKVFTDIVPADIVVNSTLAIAQYTFKVKSGQHGQAPIFNTSVNKVRKLTISFCLSSIVKYMERFPTKQMIWYPCFNGTSNEFLYRFYFVLYHYIPALLYDVVLRITGSKIRLFSIYSKVFYQSKLLEYFMSRTWDFDDVNMQTLYSSMSKRDHEDFPVRLRAEDYEIHCVRGTDGLRKYFFKETDEDLPAARRRFKIFRVMHYFVLAVFYGSLAYFLFCYIFS